MAYAATAKTLPDHWYVSRIQQAVKENDFYTAWMMLSTLHYRGTAAEYGYTDADEREFRRKSRRRKTLSRRARRRATMRKEEEINAALRRKERARRTGVSAGALAAFMGFPGLGTCSVFVSRCDAPATPTPTDG